MNSPTLSTPCYPRKHLHPLALKAGSHEVLMGFPGGSVVKNPPAKQETQVQSLGQEDPLEEEMTTHTIMLAWEIP